jgi:uncharacterized protein (DUF2164 family)
MIEFSNEEKEIVVTKIQAYFNDELNQEIGQFDAEFLMDFFTGEIGCLFYNRGLYDAQAILESRMDHLAEAITELEMPVK